MVLHAQYNLEAIEFLTSLVYSTIVQEDTKIMGKKLLSIALPIMLQNLLSTSLSFLDTLMIGQLGQEQIAAVGIANQVYFLISLFFFGIASGTSIFLSQYYGSGEYEKMKRTMSLATTLCLVGSVFMAVFSYINPDFIIHFFSTDPPVVESGRIYMKIVAPSYIFAAISSTLSIGFRSINKAKVPLLISLVSLTMNAIGNWLLIFGIGPFPELGVAGGAISTVNARFWEMAILIYLIWRKKGEVFAFRKKEDFAWNKSFLSFFVKTSLPVLLNEVLWSLGMTLYKVAFASLGTEALATVNITESIANFFFIAMLGIGNGTTILIGNVLGTGDKETALRWADKIVIISILTGVFMGALEFLMAPLFASWFNVGASVATAAILSLRIQALLQPMKSLNMTTVVGILRAGGDTRYALFAELAGVYLVGVPCSFIGAKIFHLSIPMIYLLLGLEEVEKFIAGLIRVRSKKWANVLTGDNSPS